MKHTIAVIIFLGLLVWFTIWLTGNLNDGREQKCKEQFGYSWHYSQKYGADCIDSNTGEGRYFKELKNEMR